MQTLVLVGSVEEKARALLTETEFDQLIELLARRPKAGLVIQGTGGLRKLRVRRAGSGKRGGARVIYYYHNERTPIMVLLIYAKANQDDLTNAEKRRLRKLVDEMAEHFG